MSTDISTHVFLVNAYADPVCLKIQGRASYLNCGPLNDFFARIIKKQGANIIVDFEECTGIDSTFLGLLAGVALDLKHQKQHRNISLYNVKGRNLELIENLGLNRLLKVNSDVYRELTNDASCNNKLKTLKKEGPADPMVILEAHQNLVDANASNLHKFQDIISFLKKQMNQDL